MARICLSEIQRRALCRRRDERRCGKGFAAGAPGLLAANQISHSRPPFSGVSRPEIIDIHVAMALDL